MSKAANRSQDRNVPADEFIQAWMKHYENDGSCASVAEELGIKADSVYQRGQRLKKEIAKDTGGKVVLPTLPMNSERRRTLDLTMLASLIDPTFGKGSDDDQDDEELEEQEGTETDAQDDNTSTGEIQDFVEVKQDEEAESTLEIE